MAETLSLADYVRANSYARVPIADRQEEGWGTYKKGYELRIVVKSQDDLKKLRRLLLDAGIQPGKAYRKARQWVVPVYGKVYVSELLKFKSKAKRKAA